MSVRRGVVLASIALTKAFLSPDDAGAMCADIPCHVIKGRVVACEKPQLPDSVIREWFELKRTVQPALSLATVTADLVNSGFVVTVEVSSMRQCEASPESAIVDSRTVKRYFLDSQEGETCEGLPPGTMLEKRVEPYCCDTHPAHSVPCILNIEATKPVPAPPSSR